MHSLYKALFCCLFVLWVSSGVLGGCPNGCSNRGLCINGACVCAEGLTEADCSGQVSSNIPTLFQCPSCYTLTVGSPQYYSGPSWRLPDGPIVGLNYQGNLSYYQANGDGEMVGQGDDISDWLPSSIVSLEGGSAGNFDSCGSWLMRAFTAADGTIMGFYHAETACTYNLNGQTRKSGGYSVSYDGGVSFSKPNYPYNKLVDTSTPIIPGIPTGEGDFSVIARDGYYYMFYANVEQYYTGVARSPLSSDAYPGSFEKYLNGQWNSPAVGGNSTGLSNIAGPQTYIHTPTQSVVSVGNDNPYWDEGFMMSVSDDVLNWQYFADPIFTPDPVTNLDTVMYPSFLGPTGGYDIGSNFQFFYMWIAPGSDWNHRYQVSKQITLTYVGTNNTSPSTKVALTTYRSNVTGETWQNTELSLPPYKAIDIVGYLMSRPYPNTFVVYDCFNFTTGDHFVGTADECFLSGSGIDPTRTLGYMYAYRAAPTIAVYRCYAGYDLFLSTDNNCEGLAPSTSTPWGYMLAGPAFTLGTDVLLAQGSNWSYWYLSTPPPSWIQPSYVDASWSIGQAPFSDSYAVQTSFFGACNYYFRNTFYIAPDQTVKSLLVSVASDDFAIVYINGILVDSDIVTWHEAAYWNRRVYINPSILLPGNNQIAVVARNMDNWAFFDLELRATYSSSQSRSVAFEETAYEELELTEKSLPELRRVARDIPVLDNTKQTRSASTSATLIAPGSSWKFYNKSAPASTWMQSSFSDAAWTVAPAPFVTGYTAYVNVGTPFGPTNYYFRTQFTIPSGQTIQSMQVSVASDNYAIVYINGILVDSDPSTWHQATYWNRQVNVPTNIVAAGTNTIAVVTMNMDAWAFFDLQLTAVYSAVALPAGMLIAPGSNWLFYNKSAPDSSWTQASFSDASWTAAPAPFVTGYTAYVGVGTPFGATNYYFRSKFTIPTGQTASACQVFVASDNYALVYINGVLVDSDPSSWHQAMYWNRQVNVPLSVLISGVNQIAVVTMNMDAWAFFDLQLNATFSGSASSIPVTPAPTPAPTLAPTSAPQTGAPVTVIPAGSKWLFYNQSAPASTWTQLSFNDAPWSLAPAPFVTGYTAYVGVGTPFGTTDYYFRAKFTVPAGMTVQTMQLSIASDNYGIAYVNGILVDSDPATWHQATYWNRQVSVDPSIIVAGANQIAVVVKNMDAWAFFDCQVVVTYSASALPSSGIVIPQGSNWLYYYQATPPSTWTQQSFNDASWTTAPAPFVTGYSAYVGEGTPFGATNYYFRNKFIVPSASTIVDMQLSVASDNYAIVYINGILVDSDPATWHQAAYWNRQVSIDTSMIVTGTNTIAVVTMNMDAWAFFDLQLSIEYGSIAASSVSAVCTPTCGIKGQCISGTCACDSGWGGADCNTNLCTYTQSSTENVVPAGSSFKHMMWSTVSSTPVGWFAPTFDDSWWLLASAPFGTTYYSGVTTTIVGERHLYRKKFLLDVPYDQMVQFGTLSVASDDTHRVYLNGVFVGDSVYPYNPHYASYWNEVLVIDGSLFGSVNVISIEVPLVDGRWTAFFDMQMVVTYSSRTCLPPS